MHFSLNKPRHGYKLGAELLEICMEEKDLEMLVNTWLKMSQCAQVAKKASNLY